MRLHLLTLGNKTCIRCGFVVLNANYTYSDDDWEKSALNCQKVEPERKVK